VGEGAEWGSYKKVIVAVLACHGEGRCVGESDSGWRYKGLRQQQKEASESKRQWM